MKTEIINNAKHCIGLDSSHRPHTRHGRQYFRAWRNMFATAGDDKGWEYLKSKGYANSTNNIYWLTDQGIAWLSEQTGICIKKGER